MQSSAASVELMTGCSIKLFLHHLCVCSSCDDQSPQPITENQLSITREPPVGDRLTVCVVTPSTVKVRTFWLVPAKARFRGRVMLGLVKGICPHKDKCPRVCVSRFAGR